LFMLCWKITPLSPATFMIDGYLIRSTVSHAQKKKIPSGLLWLFNVIADTLYTCNHLLHPQPSDAPFMTTITSYHRPYLRHCNFVIRMYNFLNNYTLCCPEICYRDIYKFSVSDDIFSLLFLFGKMK
jgi:hypothetical protein